MASSVQLNSARVQTQIQSRLQDEESRIKPNLQGLEQTIRDVAECLSVLPNSSNLESVKALYKQALELSHDASVHSSSLAKLLSTYEAAITPFDFDAAIEKFSDDRQDQRCDTAASAACAISNLQLSRT